MNDLNIILGLGKTGWSIVRFLRQKLERCVVIDSREASKLVYLEALKCNYPEVSVYHDAKDLPKAYWSQIKRVLVSPGVSELASWWRNKLDHLKLDAKVIGDIQLFSEYTKQPIIAVTGSNGKSTVTTLVAEMLQAAGIKALAGGNLGIPALDMLDDEHVECYVLELSSFQLELTHKLKVLAATILNISPDHLDHHKTLANYIAAKQRIFQNCKFAIINSSEMDMVKGIDFSGVKQISFGTSGDFSVRGGGVYYAGKLLVNEKELKLKGEHNLLNVAASYALIAPLVPDLENLSIKRSVVNFKGLEHRVELVKIDKLGVEWINDSKGTNVGATVAAIEGLGPRILDRGGKIVLTLGGLSKGADFSYLASAINNYVRAVVVFGEDANKIQRDLMGKVAAPIYLIKEPNLKMVLLAAKALTKAGDSVLFSPACASFDMFKGFEQRGEMFKELVALIA